MLLPRLRKNTTTRQFVYDILENKTVDSPLSRGIEYFLIGLIIVNVLAVITSSINEWYSDYQKWFDGLEYFSLAVFGMEFLLRLWAVAEGNFAKNYAVTLDDKTITHLKTEQELAAAAKTDAQSDKNTDKIKDKNKESNSLSVQAKTTPPLPQHHDTLSDWQNRLNWLKTPSAIIDFLAIFPAFLNFVVPLDLRFMIVLRVLRLFKLTRYFAALRILLKVIMREKESFKAVLFILVILIILSASGIYLVENKAQPQYFGSIPASMWWAVVTLTTVGYGDVTPITTTGKILGAMITVLGVGLAALPAGILASGLANELNQRREMIESQFRTSLLENELDFEQHVEEIEKIRQEIGLTQEQAQIIIHDIVKEQELQTNHAHSANFCPNCGYHLKKPDD